MVALSLMPWQLPEVASALPDVEISEEEEAAAAALVDRTLQAVDRADATDGAIWIGCKPPEAARAGWAQARAAVEQVVGPILEPGDDPHVTVLWMGQVSPDALPEVVEIARRAAEATAVGSPEEEGDHIGPLFDQIQFDRVQNMIQVGIDEGATLLAGGLGRPEGFDVGWFVKPTIFADVNNTMRIAREEIFGPVLVIIPFDSEEEAITIANDTPYGLAAYVQTGSSERATRLSRALRAGAVHINGGAYEYGSPFGGYKASGNGREGGMMGLEDFLETKMVHGMA